MTVRDECAEKGKRLLILHKYTADIYRNIGETPLRAMPIDWAKMPLRHANDAVEALYRIDPVIDEKTYHDFRTRLQDIEGALPAVIDPKKSMGELEELLKRSRWETDRLMDKVEDVLFQVVAECECKGR